MSRVAKAIARLREVREKAVDGPWETVGDAVDAEHRFYSLVDNVWLAMVDVIEAAKELRCDFTKMHSTDFCEAIHQDGLMTRLNQLATAVLGADK